MMPLGSDESTRKDAIKIGLETIKTWKEKNEKNGGKKVENGFIIKYEYIFFVDHQINCFPSAKRHGNVALSSATNQRIFWWQN